MKKILFLLTFSLLALQVHDSYAFLRVGLKAGINWAGVHVTNDSLVYKRTAGVSFGLQGEVPIAPALSIRTDLLFIDRSVKFDVKARNGAVIQTGTLKLNEMVLAPFLIIRYPTPKGVIPFLQVGPEVGLNTLIRSDQGGQGQNISEVWKKNNFSINAGAGIIIPAGSGDVTLDGRYNFGLINMYTTGSIKAYTNGIQVYLGYNFLKI